MPTPELVEAREPTDAALRWALEREGVPSVFPHGPLDAGAFAIYAANIRESIATDLPSIVRATVPLWEEEVKREVFAALAEDPAITNDRIWWDAEDREWGMPTVTDLADVREWYDAHVYEVAQGVMLPNRFVALLPTAFERDDGWDGGIGWLDCEAELFDTEAEACAALDERKASLLSPSTTEPSNGA